MNNLYFSSARIADNPNPQKPHPAIRAPFYYEKVVISSIAFIPPWRGEIFPRARFLVAALLEMT